MAQTIQTRRLEGNESSLINQCPQEPIIGWRTDSYWSRRAKNEYGIALLTCGMLLLKIVSSWHRHILRLTSGQMRSHVFSMIFKFIIWSSSCKDFDSRLSRNVAVDNRTEEPGEQRFCHRQRSKQPNGTAFFRLSRQNSPSSIAKRSSATEVFITDITS